MHSPIHDPLPAPALLAALADRTTRCEGGPPPDDALIPHLRVIIARVLRTGRGPSGLLAWVRRQMADSPVRHHEAADELAAKLNARLLPPTPTVLETVGE